MGLASGLRAGGGDALADFLQDFAGGVAGNDGGGDDTASGAFDFLAADDLVAGPVAAFDEDVGEEGGDDALRGELVEDKDGVDAFQGAEDFGALEFEDQGASFAFDLADAGVAVNGDDEGVAEAAGVFEAADVAGVKEVEAAVGEDDFAGLAICGGKPQDCLLEG
jgi:hypothetical protein